MKNIPIVFRGRPAAATVQLNKLFHNFYVKLYLFLYFKSQKKALIMPDLAANYVLL